MTGVWCLVEDVYGWPGGWGHRFTYCPSKGLERYPSL